MAEFPVRPDDLRALTALFAPGLVANPYPAYAAWRAERPVARPRERLFVLSRFADCETVLTDPAFGRQADEDLRGQTAGERGAGGVGFRSLLRLNPPDHTRLRRLASGAFTPARVRALAPRIETITKDLLDGADGQFDLIEQLAQPLPVAVICELFGIAPDDRPLLVSWSAALARSLDPPFLIPAEERAGQQAARAEFATYLRGLLPARRHAPGDDLISALIQAHDEDGSLTENELIGLCMLLLIAGHETTRSLIGSGVLTLLRNPGELAALADRPDLTGQAVEEQLRYDPPVQMIARFALRSAEVSGVTVPAGCLVLMLLGAANRDPELCADPNAFSLSRDLPRHLAFGHGIHFCLGASLARLEASIALRLLLPLLPRLRITAEPDWRPNTVLRGLNHLWLGPAADPLADRASTTWPVTGQR
jgi:cytochrome P450